MDGFEMQASVIGGDFRSKTSLSFNGGGGKPSMSLMGFDHDKRVIQARQHNAKTSSDAKQMVRPATMASLPTIVRPAQVSRRALGLKVKYSGHQATQLFAQFDATRTHSLGRTEQLRYQQQLRVQRAIRITTHPALRELDEARCSTALDRTILLAPLAQASPKLEDFNHLAQKQIQKRRRASVANKSPHLCPNAQRPPHVRPLGEFGGLQSLLQANGQVSQGQELEVTAWEQEALMRTSLGNESSQRLALQRRQAEGASLISKRRGSTIGAMHADVPWTAMAAPTADFDPPASLENTSANDAQNAAAEVKKELTELVWKDHARFQESGTPVNQLHLIPDPRIFEPVCSPKVNAIATPHFETRERMAAMRFAERNAGHSGRGAWSMCGSACELAMIASNSSLGHGDGSWTGGRIARQVRKQVNSR